MLVSGMGNRARPRPPGSLCSPAPHGGAAHLQRPRERPHPDANRFLIHSLVDSRAEVSPELLLLADFDGRVLETVSGRRLPSEFPIHGEIYRARADVMAVAHIHSENAIAFALAKGAPLLAMRCDAFCWARGVPVHGDPTRIQSAEQGRALAQTMGGGGRGLTTGSWGSVGSGRAARGLHGLHSFRGKRQGAHPRQPPRRARSLDRRRSPPSRPAGLRVSANTMPPRSGVTTLAKASVRV